MDFENLTKRIKEPSFWQELWQEAQLLIRLMSDPEVPVHLKIVPAGVVIAYFVFPLDIIPDMFLFFGQLDDLGVLLLGSKIFIQICPQDRVSFHRAEIKAGTLKDDVTKKTTIDR